jgi:UDP-glucose 4-epimerase
VRALVTGGAGFIGAALVVRLLAEGAEVVVVDDGSAAGLGRLEGCTGPLIVHRMDVRAPDLQAVVEATAPEVAFHLAAQVDVGRSVADPVHDASVNVLGTLALLEAVRRLPRPARVVLAASGGSLYGPEDRIPLPTPESASWAPLSPYGLSKLAAAGYLEAYRRLHGTEGCALALANVYGPGQRGRVTSGGEAAVVTAFVDALARGDEPVVHGDGEQTRDLVYVDDVVDAFWRAATSPAVAGGPALYNVGTGIETSVNDLARHLYALAGRPARLHHGPARPGEVRRSCLDAHLARDLLGWRATTSLDEGLRTTLARRLPAETGETASASPPAT